MASSVHHNFRAIVSQTLRPSASWSVFKRGPLSTLLLEIINIGQERIRDPLAAGVRGLVTLQGQIPQFQVSANPMLRQIPRLKQCFCPLSTSVCCKCDRPCLSMAWHFSQVGGEKFSKLQYVEASRSRFLHLSSLFHASSPKNASNRIVSARAKSSPLSRKNQAPHLSSLTESSLWKLYSEDRWKSTLIGTSTVHSTFKAQLSLSRVHRDLCRLNTFPIAATKLIECRFGSRSFSSSHPSGHRQTPESFSISSKFGVVGGKRGRISKYLVQLRLAVRSTIVFFLTKTKEGLSFSLKASTSILYRLVTNPAVIFKWWASLVQAMRHGWNWTKTGFKLFFANVRVSRLILKKKILGHPLRYKEHKLLVRTTGDALKLIPFSLMIIIPLGELLIPVVLRLFPKMLPSTFFERQYDNTNLARKLKAKQELAQFFQELVQERTIQILEGQSEGALRDKAEALQQFQGKLMSKDDMDVNPFLSLKEMLHFAKLLKQEFVMEKMNLKSLQVMCRLLGIEPYGVHSHVVLQLRHHLNHIQREDREIMWEGVETLTHDDLVDACKDRGMRFYAISDEGMREQMRQWLDFSSHPDIPPTLLLWSRCITMTHSPIQLEASQHQTKDEDKGSEKDDATREKEARDREREASLLEANKRVSELLSQEESLKHSIQLLQEEKRALDHVDLHLDVSGPDGSSAEGGVTVAKVVSASQSVTGLTDLTQNSPLNSSLNSTSGPAPSTVMPEDSCHDELTNGAMGRTSKVNEGNNVESLPSSSTPNLESQGEDMFSEKDAENLLFGTITSEVGKVRVAREVLLRRTRRMEEELRVLREVSGLQHEQLDEAFKILSRISKKCNDQAEGLLQSESDGGPSSLAAEPCFSKHLAADIAHLLKNLEKGVAQVEFLMSKSRASPFDEDLDRVFYPSDKSDCDSFLEPVEATVGSQSSATGAMTFPKSVAIVPRPSPPPAEHS